MKFTLSTKPFADALDLGVISSNISKYYSKSCVAQLTADRHSLKINLEAANLRSEIILKGSGDEDAESVAFVDCLVLKQLVATLEASVTTIEYIEGGIVIHSGTSKFNLSNLADGGQLERPQLPDINAPAIKLVKDDWKFIKDSQMYALATSFVHPIYTNVWVGEEGDALVCDFDSGLFTFSKKNGLKQTCLLTDTIINLFNSLPEGATLTQLGRTYRVDVKTDGFEYAAEILPKYEEDDGVGSYQAPVFLSLVHRDESSCIKLPTAPVLKFINQSDLISSEAGRDVTFSYSDGQLLLSDQNVEAKIAVEGTCPNFVGVFYPGMFKSAISNFDVDTINVSPAMQGDEVGGLEMWSPDLTVIISTKSAE